MRLLDFSTNAARPQPEASTGRRQVDDGDTNQSQSSTSNSSRGAAVAATNSTASVTDDLGALPPGWQMSRTENERLFFIDHINKRTTWVKLNLKQKKRTIFLGRSTHGQTKSITSCTT